MSQATAAPPDRQSDEQSDEQSDQQVTLVDHVIVGAGFAGLCAAIGLAEDGERDVVVLEKGDDVGGTWRDNTYPGAACDVPSQLYSFSFAPNPDWSSSFSPQPEIQAYLQRVARESGLLDRFRFGVRVEDAAWDEEVGRWTVRTTAGTWSARTLVVGAGGLSEPKLPDIDGIETFAGHLFHSARWDHDVDLAGKRIAVIGTGASAIQIVPELQKVAARLVVHQRTAPWVIPRNDRRYSALERAALRHVPGLQRAYRTGVYWGRETYVPAFTLAPGIALPARKLAEGNIARGISDPALREKVTPHFALGCKRVLISNTYYPALDADNVDLVTDRIARITPTSVVTVDDTGREVEREVDVVVVATGFHTTELPITEHIAGRRGRTLADRWRESGMAAYKGTTVPEFPNLFMLVGPNTGLGHSSMVFMIESQVRYVRDAVRTMRTNAYAAVEPREDVTARWNDRLQQRMKRTVWHRGGCSSWYLDEHGRNTTLWPRTTFGFRAALRAFDAAAYLVRGEPDRSTPAHTPSQTPTQQQEDVPA